VTASSDADRVELVARFTALPGREGEVEHLLLALTAKVRAEPGCLDFAPYRVAASSAGSGLVAGPEGIGAAEIGPEAAGTGVIGAGFVVVEAYRDEAAFAAHLAAPYGATFNAALGPLIVEDGSVLTFLAPLG
jgi:quinol monooxygenase YgiN